MTLEDLRKCARYRREIKCIEEDIKRLQSKAKKTTTCPSFAPAKTGAGDGMAENVCDIVLREAELKAKKAEYEPHIERCEAWLLTIPEQQAKVLKAREMERDEHGKRITWNAVSELVHYDRSHCIRIWNKAIEKLEK